HDADWNLLRLRFVRQRRGRDRPKKDIRRLSAVGGGSHAPLQCDAQRVATARPGSARGVLWGGVLLGFRGGGGRDLSDVDSRDRARFHVQRWPTRERRRPIS